MFFSKSAQNCVFRLSNDLFFGKTYSKLCVLAKMVFFGIAGKNSRFRQNSLTYRDYVMVIFRFLGQNDLKLELRTFAVHKKLKEH